MEPDALPLLGVPDAPAQLVAFRYSSYDVPFWVRANTRDGRWNVAGGQPTQYWALTPEAAWAELIRHENLRSEQELEFVRMSIWVCRVPVSMLVDLRIAAARDKWQASDEELTGDAWAPCQSLGERLRIDARGVIAPSAALPGHDCLTLFGARRPIAWSATPALASAVPAARVAIGRPPAGLIERVRLKAVPQDGRLF